MKVYINLNLKKRAEEAASKADGLWSRLSQKFVELAETASTKISELFDEIKAEIAEKCELVEDSSEAELVIVTDTAEAIKLLAAGKEVVQVLYGQEPISAAAVAGIEDGTTRMHIYAISGFLYQGKYPGLTGLIAFLVNRLGSKQAPPAEAAEGESSAQ